MASARPQELNEEEKRAAVIHYERFRQYIEEEGIQKSTPRPGPTAKLPLLTATQLFELCTDVYDELVRRQQNTALPPQEQILCLALVPDFHTLRNQARQMLALLLVKSRFTELVADVYFEMGRRRKIEMESEGQAESDLYLCTRPDGWKRWTI